MWKVEPSVIFIGGRSLPFFGHSLALTGKHLAITSISAGTICLYLKNGNNTWPAQPNFTFTVPIIERPAAFTRRSVSLTDNHLIVGLPNDRKAFVFSRKSGTEYWPNIPSLNFSQQTGMFGFCVGITDLYAVVSAYRNNVAYIFRSLSSGTWLETPVQVLTEQGIPALFLGYSCAISDFNVVLGSFQVILH